MRRLQAYTLEFLVAQKVFNKKNGSVARQGYGSSGVLGKVVSRSGQKPRDWRAENKTKERPAAAGRLSVRSRSPSHEYQYYNGEGLMVLVKRAWDSYVCKER